MISAANLSDVTSLSTEPEVKTCTVNFNTLKNNAILDVVYDASDFRKSMTLTECSHCSHVILLLQVSLCMQVCVYIDINVSILVYIVNYNKNNF